MKKHLLFIFAALMPLLASAHDFEVNGIYYNITSEVDKTAEVTFKGSNYDEYRNEYSGPITIPATVTYEGVDYSVTSIGWGTFADCSSLTTTTIPEGVTSIGSSAFEGCESLTTIIIPKGVISIGLEAFRDCFSLTAITIPESLTSIENSVFEGCSSLTAINIPESVKSIGEYAFYGCNSLNAVYISNIEAWCNIKFSYPDSNPLYYAKNLYLNGKLVEELIIPQSVTSIGKLAFSGCTSLTAINIPESVKSIGEYAFYGCTGELVVNCNIPSTSNGIFYYGMFSKVTIGDNVTSIGDNAFNLCFNLHSVIIGSGTLSIGNNAFFGTPIEKVIWKTNTPPTGYTKVNGKINYVANNQFTGLSDIQIYPYISSIFEVDGVTYVPNPADKTCDVIDGNYNPINENVVIDSVVTYKGKQMAVRNVMPYTFYANESVQSVKINNNGSIGNDAFYSCSNLSEIIAGDGIQTIGAQTFYDCKNLKTFEVGKTLESIGGNAFYGCSGIETFTCYAKQPPYCETMALDDIDKWGCTLNVPARAVERYQAADQWEAFFFTEGVEVEKYKARFYVDGVLYKTVEIEYHEEIALPENPQKEGYTFAGWDNLPSIMPTANIDIHGAFTVNKYNVTYFLDGQKYHTTSVIYGESIPSVDEPSKEGYSFSGWGDVPATMPAGDVTINGTFTINKYRVSFKIDDEVIAEYTLDYGAKIVAPEAPEKEGHTFKGWGKVASFVPANDLTYEGSYSAESYLLTYMVDGVSYKSEIVVFGESIVPLEEPVKEGYTFSGWSEIPETMPANDVTIEGTFIQLPNIYLIINQADNGYVKQHLVGGSVCIYTIEAAEGWKIHTVTFNGEDVTSQLTEEGTFTTPELQGDAVLNIAYEKIDDAIESARAGTIKVQGHQGTISIAGAAEGAAIGLYTASGTLVATVTAEGDTTHLTVPTGQVYIVKVADTVVKIGM